MHEPFGFVRLRARPALDVWHARTPLTLYAVGPRSTVTVVLDAAGLGPGDVAGLVLFKKPYAWLGVEHLGDGLTLAQFDQQSGRTSRVPLGSRRVWLRTECDFTAGEAGFRYSTDGRGYAEIGESHAIGECPIAPHAIQCSLFSCSTNVQVDGGHADFDSFVVTTEHAGNPGPQR